MKSVQDALGRLEGVKSAQVEKGRKSPYTIVLSESKFYTPKQLAAAVDKKFILISASYELRGTVAKTGDEWILTTNVSNQKISLAKADDVAKLAGEGKTRFVIKGKLADAQKDDKGNDLLPVLTVASAAEWPEEKKEEPTEAPKDGMK